MMQADAGVRRSQFGLEGDCGEETDQLSVGIGGRFASDSALQNVDGIKNNTQGAVWRHSEKSLQLMVSIVLANGTSNSRTRTQVSYAPSPLLVALKSLSNR
jgi:hypothetical protein